MRIAGLALVLGTLCFAGVGAQGAQPKIEHPGSVALIEGEDGYTYRHATLGFRLYVSDRDEPNKSNCNAGCSQAWVPLQVDDADVKAIGDWTIIKRADGKRQWAYKTRPAYTLFHDSPEKPIGNGVEGKWHYLEP